MKAAGALIGLPQELYERDNTPPSRCYFAHNLSVSCIIDWISLPTSEFGSTS